MPGGGGGTFRNLGTTTKLASDGLTFFDLDLTIENPGTFNINTGQVEIKGGGTSTAGSLRHRTTRIWSISRIQTTGRSRTLLPQP